MLQECQQRTAALQREMARRDIGIAVITDESSIAYLAGFWGYLGIEFGRPTLLIVAVDKPPVVITPLMEAKMVAEMTWVEDILTWEDSGANGWGAALVRALPAKPAALAVERALLPAIVRNFIDERFPDAALADISPVLGQLRTVKSDFEIGVMKQAGAIAGAMMAAVHGSLAEGSCEFESALAAIDAGSRRAAGFLTDNGWERFVSPMVHNLQIMQSGRDTTMVHRRASTKRYEKYDPVYFCFCNMAQFKQYKLGFDRMFHITDVRDEDAALQEIAIAAQQAALDHIRAGAVAEDVAAAANAVYRRHGFDADYRTGRSIGTAYLEAPELKPGDKTVLRAGMTFAVDGGISGESAAGRIGDSIVVTDDGYEFLTDYPRTILLSGAAPSPA